MKQQAALHLEKRDKRRHYLGPACYTLSKEEKQSMFDCLNSIKVPSGRLLNLKEKKFAHVKSHVCHVLMTQLIPVALRDILPTNVRATIIKLCAFLNTISQKQKKDFIIPSSWNPNQEAKKGREDYSPVEKINI